MWYSLNAHEICFGIFTLCDHALFQLLRLVLTKWDETVPGVRFPPSLAIMQITLSSKSVFH